jgi:hypothetical protein
MGFQDFATHFLDETLFQDVAHIDDFFFLTYDHVFLGICLHVYFIDLFISHIQYLFLLSCFFWQISIGKLCRYVGTLWVQDHWSLFKAL